MLFGSRDIAYAVIDLPRLEFLVIDDENKPLPVPVPVTEETLFDWLAQNQRAPEDDHLKSLAGELINAVHAAQTRSLENFSFRNFSKSTTYRWPERFIHTPFEWGFVAGCIWLLIWILGIRYLLRRRKRFLQSLRSFPPTVR